MKELLAHRKEKKAKKPEFKHQEAHKKKRITQSWRKPRGRHSKLRLRLRGYRRWPEIGWGSPKSVKGLSQSGLEIVVVHTVKELEKLDASKQGIIIGATVGAKKKLLILDAAEKKNITLITVKDIAALKKSIEDALTQRKEKKSAAKKTKDGKKTEEKKVEKKEELKEKSTEEDKQKEEKKEKDKILTKRK